MSLGHRRGPNGRILVLQAACALAWLAAWPGTASADKTITDFGFDFGVGARLTSGTEVGLDLELGTTMEMYRLRADRYRGFGLELSYAGSDKLEFFAIMPRLEFGLGAPRFNRRTLGRGAHAWAPYLALSVGYGSGAVWDTAYIELYGSEEEVEVAVSGYPAYAALGLRRIGVFSLRLEAVAGAILVTEREAEEPEGQAPSIIPSIGVRFAFGGDTFSYTWR